MADYGNGLFLDQNFDFQVGPDGDLAVAQQEAEIRKDLAFNVAALLETGRGVETPASVTDGVVGQLLTKGLERDIESAITKVVEQDERIDEVSFVRVREGDTRNEIAVEIRCLVDGDVVDLAVTAGE